MRTLKMLLLRPYYGVTIHSDMHGEFGVCDYMNHVYPDISFVFAASIANQNGDIDLTVIDGNMEKITPKEVIKRLDNHYDVIILKTTSPSIRLDLKFSVKLKKMFQKSKVYLVGHVVKILKKYIGINYPTFASEKPIDNFIYNL